MWSSAQYIWADTYGQIALLMVLIGATGLVFRYWTALPLVAALSRLTRQSR